jgi:CheY-like chemotaxis protein
VLQVKGYKTIESETAEEGLKLATEKYPSLILMDIQLPGMDGITALKHLRTDPETKTIRLKRKGSSVRGPFQNRQQ